MIELQTILGARTEYEQAEMASDYPNLDTDLPLQKPIVTLSGGRFIPGSTGLGDVLGYVDDEAVKGMEISAVFDLDVFTSRGTDDRPSPSGGRNVCERILGLLIVDIEVRRDLIPEWIQDWRLKRGDVLNYERDETMDIFNARGILDVSYEYKLEWAT
jgi:hypothetical protein